MQLFDSHCHLQDARLDNVLPAAMARAAETGINAMLCCSSSEADWDDVRRITAEYDNVLPAYGLHPWYVAGASNDWRTRLERLIGITNAVVGEIGLDHALKDRNDRAQESAFVAQLDLAAAFGTPASIHCRHAWGQMMEILSEYAPALPGFAVHAYSGPVELIEPLVKLGGFIAFSGSITRTANTRGHTAARAVPRDRLLIETDAPDLAPVTDPAHPPAGETVNEPANLVHVLRKIAELRSTAESEIAATTWQNACRLFTVQ